MKTPTQEIATQGRATQEIAAQESPSPVRPAGPRFEGGRDGSARRAPLRSALERCGEFGPGQTAGRFYPVACVALEVTQRCNLDCSLCYLSQNAEAAYDPPLELLFRRLESVASHYGPGTSVQITGGDPTLRPLEDLQALCREIRRLGLRSCLMTNGVRATRAMLKALAAAGLDDVAFHVDLTQGRRGYRTEAALHELRRAYLARARGLGLRVLFNTTVFARNMAELPELARFFRDHAAQVTLASFQLQADTGRGVLRRRAAAVTRERVMAGLAQGFGAEIDFDTAAVGHSRCNRFAALLVSGRRVVSALGDRALFHELCAALETHEAPSDAYLDVLGSASRLARRRPGLALRALRHGLGLLWRLRSPRAHRLSVLVHEFMDANALEQDRCESCVFMAMTEDGPLSMCAHNAERDRHVFAPARLDTAQDPRWWSAATGEAGERPSADAPRSTPPKLRKGRAVERDGEEPAATRPDPQGVKRL